jgi:hypothetical protein
MKSQPIRTIGLLIAFAVFNSCKNDPKAAMPSLEETSLATPPPSPKPEVYLYMVSVDKLNLRDQSNKNGQVVTQFPEGALVEGPGEISTNKEEVTLRGIPFNEPYFKVTSTTPEHSKGWAYSAGLLPVYAGSRTTLPDLGKLSQFSNFLKTLNVKKLESGKKAWDYVLQNLGNVQGTLADGAYIMLEHFLFRMEAEGDFYNQTEKIHWQDSDYDAIQEEKFDMQKYPITKQLAENGFRLEVGEGMMFPVVDLSKLGDFFAGKMTPPMKNYLEQSIAEQRDQIWSDGGIIVPLETVADRAAWWEKFNQANPYFVRNEESNNNQQSLLFILICGADNTPVFPGENESVSDDYKKVWNYIQQKYAGTGLGRSTKEMADLVATAGGKRTKSVEALMERYMNL